MKLEQGKKELADSNGKTVAKCPFSGSNGFKITNFTTGRQFSDTLHSSYLSKDILCNENRCVGSLMAGQSPRRGPSEPRPREEVLFQSKEFLEMYFQSSKKFNQEDLDFRVKEVMAEIEQSGTWNPTRDELNFGAKMAWRNAARCIGRIQWNKLEMQDYRHATGCKDMYEALLKHLEYATNGGNIRSMITIFPQRVEGREDFKVWVPQLISYAGYQQPDGSVIGDPSKVQLTRVCQRLGWKGKGGRFDVLPWVFSAPGEKPQWFDIPDELVLRVKLEHPDYPWFAEMNLEWYCVPAVSDMLLDVGGIEFPAAPFSGWYMGTEVGARDLCDQQRYNISGEVAKKMGLDTSNPSTLWKDKVLVEVNYAVLYSYQKNRVTIVDHHTAAETFMKHMEHEQKVRGGCPADWVWIVPPMSGSATPVYHQEMLLYNLKPSYEYQINAWKTYKWDKTTTIKLKYHLPALAKALFFACSLMNSVRHKRIRCTILYASETGKSETLANRMLKLMESTFNARVVCMADYELEEFERESMILVVASTFGSGEAPDNGKLFWKELSSAAKNGTLKLDHLKFSVFALGSTQYPTFCAFGKDFDEALSKMGAERILPVGMGDELRGQEQTFNQWAEQLYKNSCLTYNLKIDQDNSLANFEKEGVWDAKDYRVIRVRSNEPTNLFAELARLHNKKVTPSKVLSRARLQARHSDRQTILVRMDTRGHKDLEYQPGDHLGVFPANPEEQVESIMEHMSKMGFEDDEMKVERLSNGLWKPVSHLPPCTLQTALSRYLDISSPPSSHALSLMSDMATQNWDKYRLRRLSKDIDEYEEWRSFKYPNLAEVLEEFPSIKITAAFLLTQLPLLQPRYYSISSSRMVTPNEIHLTMSIVNYHTQDGKGPLHQGVATSYFYGFPQEDVPCFVRSYPSFHLPNDNSVPVIMACAGSGIAPMRAFWQQRESDMKKAGVLEEPAEVVESSGDEDEEEVEVANASYGRMVLFFGCRQSNVDNIYSHETTPLLRKGIIQKLVTAYSRQPGQKKVYVQDAILLESGLLFELLIKRKGHMYVCGDAVMSDGIRNAVKLAIELESSQPHKEAEAIFTQMLDDGRYHEDVFGVLHRRENAEMSWQKPQIGYAKPDEHTKSVNVKTRRKSSETPINRKSSIRNSKIWVYRP